jgi:hypothetical protein
MSAKTQLCRDCHQITERTSDGDRLACSVCGRPYVLAGPGPLEAAGRTRPDPERSGPKLTP